MKKIKISNLLALLLVSTLLACGGSQRVISEDGKVYTVKDNDYYKNGKNISETLADEEREKLENTLEQRLKTQKIESERIERYDDELSKIDNEIKKAQDRKKSIKDEKEQFQNNIKAKEDARQNFLKIEKEYSNAQMEFEKLKNAGSLSPNDKIEWQEKLQKLEQAVTNANNIIKNLK